LQARSISLGDQEAQLQDETVRFGEGTIRARYVAWILFSMLFNFIPIIFSKHPFYFYIPAMHAFRHAAPFILHDILCIFVLLKLRT
jgi:hypothetical protein